MIGWIFWAFLSTLRYASRQHRHLFVTHKKPQTRRKSTYRKPKYYWTSPSNFLTEIELFWKENANISSNLLPNEQLLRYHGRHDMRAAIASQGGRNDVAELLRVPILSGKWSLATETNELQAWMKYQNISKSPISTVNQGEAWIQKPTRRHHGFWSSLRLVIEELYEYVEEYRQSCDRPATWMPQLAELSRNGRDDLRQAIPRFGGARKIQRIAGLVSYREWSYFEVQLSMLLLLRDYLDEYAGGDYTRFPTVSHMAPRGYANLAFKIHYLGGRKFVAARLGMSKSSCDLCFGQFDLNFAIELLQFIRDDQLRRQPPLRDPCLALPSPDKLLKEGKTQLHEKIEEFGGYENTARRLGLAYFLSTSPATESHGNLSE